MTAFSPREGLRPRARRLLSRLAAVLVVGSVLLGGASPASAADAPKTESATVELAVSTGTGARIAPGGSLVSTITISNTTPDELSAGSVALEIDPTPLAGDAALDAWLADGTATGVFRSVATEPSPKVGPGDSVEVSALADSSDLGDLSAGVYAVKALLSGVTTEGGVAWNLSARSVLVVSPTARTVGVVVPITATPASGTLLSADELADLTAPDGMLTGQLDALTDTPAIIAVDPAIPAAIRVLGIRAPQSAVAWLTRLERLPNDIVMLQFGDADATTQAHAGQKTLLATPDLTPLLDAADFPTPAPTPTGTPSPTAPSTSSLSAINSANTDVLWPRSDVTASDLATFGGYLGDAVTTILPSTSLQGAVGSHAEVDGHSILVTDADVSSHLSQTAQLTDPTRIDLGIAGAAGHLYFASQASPTVLVGLNRSETRSPVALRELLSAFATPGVRLSSLKASPAASAALVTTADTVRPTALTSMLAGEQRLVTFSSILDTPALMLAPERIRILRTIAVGLSDKQFATAVSDRAAHVQKLLNSVSIQRPKPVQLITSAAPLPVWVRNELPWDVHVVLNSEPSQPRLDIQPLTTVEALADGTTRVDVPISARVASGEVKVHFRLTSATGVPISQPAVAEVTLRADWEGIGLGILGGVIALLFVLGLIRTVRRRRRKADAAG
ncbi:DUF6049 family protein [Microbacterium sp.]|uniref:DUF6049 family protein n=1 Tax=Microbacterium sp. TaxID=51671 RepID=UPI003A8F0B79